MPFPDLSKRLLISILSLVVIALGLFLAYNPIVMWLIALLICSIGAIGIWEYTKLAKLDRVKNCQSLLILLSAGIIFSFFLSSLSTKLSLLPLIVLLAGLIFIFIYHFDKIKGADSSIAKSFLGLCYVAVPLGFLLKILYLKIPGFLESQGRYWLLYLLIVTKITDIGAYFGGRLLGRRKLAKQLSPGKTLTGAVIGFICAIIFSFLFYIFSQYVGGFHLTLYESFVLGALLGSLGQFGDLAESLLKRGANVKDSNSLPGLGGILDMLDSLLFTIPIIYIFLYFYLGL